MGWFNHHLDTYKTYVFTKKYHGMSRVTVGGSKPERFGVQQISFCSSFYWWSDWAAMIDMLDVTTQTTVHLPGMGAFSGGWRFPTKSKTASGVSQKTNGWNLKMGGFLGKGYSFWNPFSGSRLVFRACTIFVFWLKQYGSNEKKHTKKQLLWKKNPRISTFRWCGGGVVWGVPVSGTNWSMASKTWPCFWLGVLVFGSLAAKKSWKLEDITSHMGGLGRDVVDNWIHFFVFDLYWNHQISFTENFGRSHGVMLLWSRNKSLGSDQMVEDGEFLASKFRTNFCLCMEQAIWPFGSSFSGTVSFRKFSHQIHFWPVKQKNTTFGMFMFTTFFSVSCPKIPNISPFRIFKDIEQRHWTKGTRNIGKNESSWC